MNIRALLTTIVAMLLSIAGAAGRGPAGNVPDVSPVADGNYTDIDTVMARMAAAPMARVEGLWRFPADGALVAIEATSLGGAPSAAHYRIVIVRSANRNLRPGTVMGYLWATSARDTFEARIYTRADKDARLLTAPKQFTLRLGDDETRLSFTRERHGVKVNFWRMLPYLFRYVVTPVDTRPDDLDGCVRVFPEPELPAEPRYL